MSREAYSYTSAAGCRSADRFANCAPSARRGTGKSVGTPGLAAAFREGRLWEVHAQLKRDAELALGRRDLLAVEQHLTTIGHVEAAFPREALFGVSVDLIINKPDQTIYGSGYFHPSSFRCQDDVDTVNSMSKRPYAWLDLHGQGAPTDAVYSRFLAKARSSWYPFLRPVLDFDMYHANGREAPPPQVSIASSSWEPRHVVINQNFDPAWGNEAALPCSRLALRLVIRSANNEDEASQSLGHTDGEEEEEEEEEDGEAAAHADERRRAGGHEGASGLPLRLAPENSLGSFIVDTDDEEMDEMASSGPDGGDGEADEADEALVQSSDCVTSEMSDNHMSVADSDSDCASSSSSRNA